MTVTVARGDTLAKIGGRFGTTAGAILDVNPDITNAALIFPGQVIKLPPGIGRDGAEPQPVADIGFGATYRVRSGDTLRKIATFFKTPIATLIEHNPELAANPDLIRPGQVLNVPGARSLEDVVPPAVPPPRHGLPPWLAYAKREMDTGVEEVAGSGDNPRIVEYHASTTVPDTSDETPWCSSFVNWCMVQAGIRGTRSARARDWLTWTHGITIEKARRGAVAVFRRPSGATTGTKGHVGFVWDSSGRHLNVLGGNQSDQVSIKGYPKDDLLGLRWPEGF